MAVKMAGQGTKVVVLGGGLTGLSSAYLLSKAGNRVGVFERDPLVGGLSKTVVQDGFRFDLGGHRFFTKDKKLDHFVRDLMEGELVSVARKSKIYMRNRYFDYPLKPLNALFGFGLPTTMKILGDYGIEKVRGVVRERRIISLEDWVIKNFGRKLFDIYFKEYSEKVWGIECSRISAEWVATRISGLSMAKAIKNALFSLNGKDLPTLVDRFLYPQLGIGRISERLSEEIERNNNVYTKADVKHIHHTGCRIRSVEVKTNNQMDLIQGKEFISSIPITKLVAMLRPSPPEDILTAASKLRFRDLVVVAIMINRARVTDQTWIYIPEQGIPFGRIHEPTNWSEKMAPPGKTLLVTEFFSFAGDALWDETDERLAEITVENLVRLGFIKKHEVIGSSVVRVPKAYPLFEVGYEGLCDTLYGYLAKFRNLHVAGRSGMFRYYNMDHAIESGITTAQKIIEDNRDKEKIPARFLSENEDREKGEKLFCDETEGEVHCL
jgi:protoporphyrinogen oxidase